MAERQCERIERYLSGDRTSARIEKGGSHFSSQWRIICPGSSSEVAKVGIEITRLLDTTRNLSQITKTRARQIEHPPTHNFGARSSCA